MRWSFLIFFVLLFPLAGCVQGISAPGSQDSAQNQEVDSSSTLSVQLSDYGPASELTNTTWLNTPEPLHLANLRGKVVLIDMWTFDCINCRHVIPLLTGWYDKYSSQGLVVIGNHYPEFDYEKDLGNLKKAIADLKVPYPIAQDNDGVTWRAYHNQYWPTLYLIDKRGHIRFIHIGEGDYTHTEQAIRLLLSES